MSFAESQNIDVTGAIFAFTTNGEVQTLVQTQVDLFYFHVLVVRCRVKQLTHAPGQATAYYSPDY
jgi:hypothetical protein